MKNNFLVSVIITTKNEEAVLAKLLNSVKLQNYPYIETIVVDNNSSDATVSIARKLGVKVLNWGPERSAQRNYGAKKAVGDYLFFLDADMELTRKVVEECMALVKKDKSIGGVVIPEQSKAENFWGRVKAYERSFYNLEGDNTTDAARFFPKRVFKRVGGYDESITGPEDWDLPENVKKIGFKIVRIKSKIYHHERISGLGSLVRKKYYYGLKSYRYLRKNQLSSFNPKTIYFLRPVFYKQWKRFLGNPILSLSLVIMLFSEQLAGGLGYIKGRLDEKSI